MKITLHKDSFSAAFLIFSRSSMICADMQPIRGALGQFLFLADAL